MIKLLQGTNFQIKVPDNSCQFVATDGINKIIVSDILTDADENIYLIASSEITKSPGRLGSLAEPQRRGTSP